MTVDGKQFIPYGRQGFQVLSKDFPSLVNTFVEPTSISGPVAAPSGHQRCDDGGARHHRMIKISLPSHTVKDLCQLKVCSTFMSYLKFFFAVVAVRNKPTSILVLSGIIRGGSRLAKLSAELKAQTEACGGDRRGQRVVRFLFFYDHLCGSQPLYNIQSDLL